MPPDVAPPPPRPILPDIAAGAGLGLLVGLLLGLSVAQAVGSVITTLSALLGAFLGLATPSGGADRAWRIGTFGLFCAGGVLLGLAVRSGALLAPSVAQDVRAWEQAGYPPNQALAYVAFQRLGLKPENATLAPKPAADATSNALFADRAGLCARLSHLPAAAQLRILAGAGEAYAPLAAAASAAPDPAAALAAGLKPLCG